MAMSRHALFGTAVMAALGVPYVFSDNEPSAPTQESRAVESATPHEQQAMPPAGNPEAITQDFPALHDRQLPLEGPAVVDLSEVLRFDIAPMWLVQRWPRVMNARHEAGPLQAYRVPLVTGASAGDLAGSLTYYFDAQQKLQRIEFYGSTGDASRLVQFLGQQFGVQQRNSTDPGQLLFDARRDGRAVSQLIVRNMPVMDASLPQNRFRVEMFLERPSEHRMFSDATHRFESYRW